MKQTRERQETARVNARAVSWMPGCKNYSYGILIQVTKKLTSNQMEPHLLDLRHQDITKFFHQRAVGWDAKGSTKGGF